MLGSSMMRTTEGEVTGRGSAVGGLEREKDEERQRLRLTIARILSGCTNILTTILAS